ncbi:tetratricopeptide repeat-containing S1 family peptidase [Planktothrix agardhii]|uniref:tetratricopeptide repeat-containing S1 family peptidase n=1 Tax=Planktothrix agardhii TaxID=1160 RepID=UPI001ED9ADB8|nr:serine protease [Planktothrix agardhii]
MNPGSGVIIGKKSGFLTNTYYVLTAKHVINGKNEFDIVTPDGKRYSFKANDQAITLLPDVDLALIKFKSKETYQAATLTDYDFDNRNSYFDGQKKALVTAFVSGFPDPNKQKEFPKGKRLLTVGACLNKLDSTFIVGQEEFTVDNYEYAYTNSTYYGMSGGAVLDSSGRVIAIHGRNTGVINAQGQKIILGTSLGIPITSFLRIVKQTDKQLPLALESSVPTPLSGDIPQKYISQLLNGCRGSIECLNYSNTYERLGALKVALEVVDTSLTWDINFYAAWYQKGKILFSLKKYQDAISSFEKAIELKPDFSPAWYSRCLAYIQIKDYEAALKCLNIIVEKINPNSFEAWDSKAEVLNNLGRVEEAIVANSRSIEIRPNAYRYYNLGALRVKLGDIKGAIKDYTKAIEINPSFAVAYGNRGDSWRREGDCKKAINDFNEALRINPENQIIRMVSYGGRGWCLAEQGDKKQAIEELNEAGLAAVNIGNDDVAISILSKVLELEPTNFLAYWHRGAAYDNSGNYQKAIEDHNLALKYKPNNNTGIAIYNNRGKSRLQLGDAQRAIEDFNQAISIDQKFVFAYQGRGYAYSQLGNSKKAIEDFTKAIELDPNFAYAYFSRGMNRFYNSNIFRIESADRSTILGIWTDDVKAILQDLKKAAQLFHEQKDERGKKELVGFISSIQNILNYPVQDENLLKIQDELTKIKDSVDTP